MHYPERKKLRLSGYDYSQPGAYFITICTHNRECLFGEINDGKMFLNDIGEIAKQCWLEIPNHFPNVQLDEFVIMPNHVHGILILNNVGVQNDVGVQNIEPLQIPQSKPQNRFQHIIPHSIGSIIRGYKIGVTKWCRQNVGTKHFSPLRESPIPVWQRNYYDHIIRNEQALQRIRQYIIENPQKWESDLDNLMAKNFSPSTNEHQINHHYQMLTEA